MRSPCRELFALALAAALITSCSREERRLSEPGGASVPNPVSMSDLYAGMPPSAVQSSHPYDANAFAMSEGKRLYEWFNCKNCHANGGGAIGPPLMDDRWIYGAEPANIFQTIVEGRPNGMPSYRNRIPEQQVWQIVAYVRSLSGLVDTTAAPSRSDHLYTKKSEYETPPQPPVRSTPVPAESR